MILYGVREYRFCSDDKKSAGVRVQPTCCTGYSMYFTYYILACNLPPGLTTSKRRVPQKLRPSTSSRAGRSTDDRWSLFAQCTRSWPHNFTTTSHRIRDSVRRRVHIPTELDTVDKGLECSEERQRHAIPHTLRVRVRNTAIYSGHFCCSRSVSVQRWDADR